MNPCTALAMVWLNAAAAPPVPPAVPARGSSEVSFGIEAAGMYRISVESASGTACTLVDHLRGPFVESGSVGSRNCAVDVLLDPGTYRARLESPPKGVGNATLRVVRFPEQSPAIAELEPGLPETSELPSGTQASFAFRQPARGPVLIRAAGRTAGAIRLWRTGLWAETGDATDIERLVGAGKPVHDWWWTGTLDPGEYEVVVYGTAPKAWGTPPSSDPVSVTLDLPAISPTGVETITLPASGSAGWRVGAGNWVASLRSPGNDGGRRINVSWRSPASPTRANGQGCSLLPSKARSCVAASNGGGGSLLIVEGEPGTAVEVRVHRSVASSLLRDGEVSSSAEGEIRFDVDAGSDRLVEVTPLDPTSDAVPLGCVLRRLPTGSGDPQVVAVDSVVVGDTGLDQSFNYDGREESLWFQVSASGAYRIETQGNLESECELFSLEAGSRSPVGTSGNKPRCSERKLLTPGFYELRMYRGHAGIEHVRIEGLLGGAKPQSKVSCLFPDVSLTPGQYQVELSRRVQGHVVLVDRPLPLNLDAPLDVLLGSGQQVRIPLGPGGAEATGKAGAFSCSGRVSASGVCALGGGGAPVSLAAASDAAEVVVRRPPPTPTAHRARTFKGTEGHPPSLQVGAPTWVDLQNGESRSMSLNVGEAGLYVLATLGLQATRCEIRSPVVARLASDQTGGRGRNCLVSTFLRPGQYLATVATVGSSRGHLGVVVNRRAAEQGRLVAADGDAFVTVPRDTLAAQPISIPKTGRYQLTTAALGASLSCRLEDSEGWPVVAVPTPCTLELKLRKGSYLWKQMPLSVETKRHTRIERIRAAQTLSGPKPRAIALNTRYRARLTKRGTDLYVFDAPASLDVGVVLTQGMMGTLELVLPDGKARPVEVIAPEGGGPVDPPGAQPEGADAEAPQPAPAEGEPGEEAEGEPGTPPPEETQEAQPPATGRTLSGQRVHLEPGHYRLRARHSRGDVAVTYQLEIDSEQVAPGMSMDIQVPGRVVLRTSSAGVVRLRTRGDTDVRCRVFDPQGDRVLLESASDGDDWNCALAEPLPAGDHPLVIETETLKPGPTHLEVSAAPLRALPAVQADQRLDVGSEVLEAPLSAPGNALHQIELHADQPFSCAAFDEKDRLWSRQTQVRDCTILAAPSTVGRLRVWTLDPPVRVTAKVEDRPLEDFGGGELAAHQAGRAAIAHAGAYQVGADAWCLPASQKGVLRPCGPVASLSAGEWLLATAAPGGGRVPLDEVVDDLGKRQTETLRLSDEPLWKRGRSDPTAIHVIRAYPRGGSAAQPSCNFLGGTAVFSRDACWAASSPTTESTSSVWSGAPLSDGQAMTGPSVVVERQAFPVPTEAIELTAGPQRIHFDEGQHAVKIAVPPHPTRLSLTLAPGAWAVRVDDRGNTRDACAPNDELAACELEGSGGWVMVESPTDPEVRVEALEVASSPADLSRIHESIESRPGSIRFHILPSDRSRRLLTEGALACGLSLDDGTRRWGCSSEIPPGRTALLRVGHGTGALRVALASGDEGDSVRANLSALSSEAPPAVPPGTAVALDGLREPLVRSLHVDRPGVVHLSATAGTCSLWSGRQLLAVEGMDLGCELRRNVPAGDYAFAVRPFGSQSMSGYASWSPEALDDLKEGVGPDVWLGGGSEHLFTFATTSAGQVGIGIQVNADVLACSVLDSQHQVVGTGCQQLVSVDKGSFILSVRSEPGSAPTRFRPVVVGLSGTRTEIPEAYLKDFFGRIQQAAALEGPSQDAANEDESPGGDR